MQPESSHLETPPAGDPQFPASLPTTPVTPDERLEIVDVLRGVAIFGILLVNVAFFAEPFTAVMMDERRWTAGTDNALDAMVQFAAEGKFYALFSILFGFGMGIQLTRAQVRGSRFVPLFVRRMAILFLIGLGHMLLVWWGDILTLYALLGFVLLLFRRRRLRTLIIWAVLLLTLPSLLLGGCAAISELATADTSLPASLEADPGVKQTREKKSDLAATSGDDLSDGLFSNQFWIKVAESMENIVDERIDREREVYGGGAYGAIFKQRLIDLPMTSGLLLIISPNVLAMFIIGLCLARRGVLHDIGAHRGFLRRMLIYCGLFGMAGNSLLLLFAEQSNDAEMTLSVIMTMLLSLTAGPALTLAYLSGLALLSQRAGWGRRLRPLAAVGRTALSNYLLQSLVFTTLFYGYGLGLFDRVRPIWQMLIVVVFFAFQVVVSNLWLQRFQFGPLEWVWRSLTYGRMQPMRV